MDRMLLVLQRGPEQEASLRQLLDDQQDKASPNYHKWLTPEEFGHQFGPADQDIQVVTAWLQSHGFQVAPASKGRTVIEFSGTAAQVQEAFHTSIHKYVVNGEEHWANASDPQIPSALVPVVGGVLTLHNFAKQPQVQLAEQKITAKLVPGAPGKPPQVTFPSTPPLHALGPADYAKIYNINPVYSGFNFGYGVRIGVVGRSNLFHGVQDITDFNRLFGSGAFAFGVTLNGPDPGDLGGSEEAEATLDTTWSGAIAPDASVELVVSASTNTTDGVDLSEIYIIDNNVDDIMTESFGSCEAVATKSQASGIEALAEQAAAQGITYIVSSGDSGAEGCDNPATQTLATGPVSVNLLASTPYTVAAGGTLFNENGQDSTYWSSLNLQGTFESALSYIPEVVWNESCAGAQCGSKTPAIWAAGGGASTFFPKPSWQSGVPGIPNDGFRDVPDISMTAASHDPYMLCLEGSCQPNAQGIVEFAAVYGTSAAAPSFAGIMALVTGQNSNVNLPRRQGQANYVLYKLAAKEIWSQCNGSSSTAPPVGGCIFNDITAGNNAVPGEIGYGTAAAQYQSGVGYDLATGLGSVNVANLVNDWSSVTFSPTTTAFTVSPTTGVIHGMPLTLNITVAPSNGGGTPSGDVSLEAIPLLPLGQSTASLGFATLSGGTSSTQITSLPGGNQRIIAYYPGDGTFAPSTAVAPVDITVSPEPSTTVASIFTADQNGQPIPFTGGPYGSFVYLRADVKGQSGFGTPTGSIAFNDTAGAIPGSPFPLNSQGNTVAPNGFFSLPVGSHSITAAYGGDPSFNPSSSLPLAFAITLAPTTTTATVEANPSGSGTLLSALVATSGGGNPPTGMVTFVAGGNQLGSAPVSGGTNSKSGAAQATTSFADSQLAAGQYAITAMYSGDLNYSASTSTAVSFTVQPDFDLALNVTTATVTSPGGSTSAIVMITALNNFNGTTNFSPSSCTGLPAETACSFNPPSLTGSGSTRVTFATTGPRSSARGAATLARNAEPSWIGFGILLPGMLFAGISTRRLITRRGRSLLLSLIAVAALLALTCCGGGSPPSSGAGGGNDPGTPLGTYTVTISATSGSLTHSASVQLIVQ